MELSNKEKFALISIGVLILFAFGLRIYQSVQNSKTNGELIVVKPVATSTISTSTVDTSIVATSTIESPIDDLGIIIDQPKPEESFSNPFAVTGKARGKWYFESSFPLKIVDEQAKVLGTGVAIAQSDALTENYVPFIGFMEFSSEEKPASGTKAFLIFTNDNPSGLPENEISTTVPIIIN